jgi:tetratricopeptide (TPR) repeat protein
MDWLGTLGWKEGEIEALRSAGFSYVKQGAYEIAVTFFEALTELVRNNAYDLQTLGALHLQLGNGLRALDCIDRALKIDPTHLETRLNRAKTLCMLGYKKQGLALASELARSENLEVASQASALLLAYKI